MSYASDRLWAMRYDEHVRTIVAQALRADVVLASPDEDARRNTDFIAYSAGRAGRIAARVRRHHYLARYGDQVTFRAQRSSGRRTEWTKLIEGYGDWMLYGFAPADDSGQLQAWVLLNLGIFRQHVGEGHRTLWTAQQSVRNEDGTTGVGWPIADLAYCPRCQGAVVDSHGHGDLWTAQMLALMTAPLRCTVCGLATVGRVQRYAWPGCYSVRCLDHRPGKVNR